MSNKSYRPFTSDEVAAIIASAVLGGHDDVWTLRQALPHDWWVATNQEGRDYDIFVPAHILAAAELHSEKHPAVDDESADEANKPSDKLPDLLRFSAVLKKFSADRIAALLAVLLTDTEFELLVRERVRLEAQALYAVVPNISEQHTNISFSWQTMNEPAKWTVRCGVNYSSSTQEEGEVLVTTRQDVAERYMRQSRNKMALLPGVSKDEPAA